MTQIVTDTGDFATASTLTIPDADTGGASWIALLQTAVGADRIILSINGDRANHYHYVVTARSVVGASDIVVPVALLEQQGAGTTPGAPDTSLDLAFIPRGIGQNVHGGMNLAAPPAADADIGISWSPVDMFDNIYLPGFGITFDTVAGSFAFDSTGVYVLSLQASLSHNSDNAGRTTNIRMFDITSAVPLGTVFPIGIGRNVTDTTISLSLAFVIAFADIGDLFRIEIGGGDTLTAVSWSALSLTTWAISG